MMKDQYNKILDKTAVLYEKSLYISRLINDTPGSLSSEQIKFEIEDLQALARDVANAQILKHDNNI